MALHNVGHGYLAVDFFFILSGFVIAFAYEEKLQTNRMTFWDFIKRRYTRLYPLVFAGMTLGTICYLMRDYRAMLDNGSLSHFIKLSLRGFLLIPYTGDTTIYDNMIFPFNGPQWSLFYELLVNIIYAVIAPYLTFRAIVLLFFMNVLALIPTIARHNGLDIGFDASTYMFDGFIEAFFRTSTSFLSGMLLYRLSKYYHIKVWNCVPWLLALVLFAILGIPKSYSLVQPLYDMASIFIIFPAIIFLSCKIQLTGIGLWLCRLSGDLSYPLYILHRPLEHMLHGMAKHYTANPDRWVISIAIVTICSGISYAIFKLYDEPIRNYLTRRLTV